MLRDIKRTLWEDCDFFSIECKNQEAAVALLTSAKWKHPCMLWIDSNLRLVLSARISSPAIGIQVTHFNHQFDLKTYMVDCAGEPLAKTVPFKKFVEMCKKKYPLLVYTSSPIIKVDTTDVGQEHRSQRPFELPELTVDDDEVVSAADSRRLPLSCSEPSRKGHAAVKGALKSSASEPPSHPHPFGASDEDFLPSLQTGPSFQVSHHRIGGLQPLAVRKSRSTLRQEFLARSVAQSPNPASGNSGQQRHFPAPVQGMTFAMPNSHAPIKLSSSRVDSRIGSAQVSLSLPMTTYGVVPTRKFNFGHRVDYAEMSEAAISHDRKPAVKYLSVPAPTRSPFFHQMPLPQPVQLQVQSQATPQQMAANSRRDDKTCGCLKRCRARLGF